MRRKQLTQFIRLIASTCFHAHNWNARGSECAINKVIAATTAFVCMCAVIQLKLQARVPNRDRRSRNQHVCDQYDSAAHATQILCLSLAQDRLSELCRTRCDWGRGGGRLRKTTAPPPRKSSFAWRRDTSALWQTLEHEVRQPESPRWLREILKRLTNSFDPKRARIFHTVRSSQPKTRSTWWTQWISPSMRRSIRVVSFTCMICAASNSNARIAGSSGTTAWACS